MAGLWQALAVKNPGEIELEVGLLSCNSNVSGRSNAEE
jgi:hypothetical protein